MTLKFSDEDGHTYTVSLNSNHHSAKKYSKVKEDDFLCLYEAIKADLLSFKHIDSKVPKEWRVRLHSIPLVVLPAEENFVHTCIKRNLMAIVYVITLFIIIGLFLFIGERLSSENADVIYKTVKVIKWQNQKKSRISAATIA